LAYDVLAAQRVRLACRIASRGKVVVTDRLHGHILRLLRGIPHLLLDNSYGKLRRFHGTWARLSSLAT
jgi:exopolysaccharide biosynthesis predicted pyruvyltransferase EpsI